jgi:hypothetical protein
MTSVRRAAWVMEHGPVAEAWNQMGPQLPFVTVFGPSSERNLLIEIDLRPYPKGDAASHRI